MGEQAPSPKPSQTGIASPSPKTYVVAFFKLMFGCSPRSAVRAPTAELLELWDVPDRKVWKVLLSFFFFILSMIYL